MFPTCLILAEKFGKDPDEIPKWTAEKVYGILLYDFEKHDFEQARHNLQKLFKDTDKDK